MHDTQDKELSFVIPTLRLRDVGAAIEEYDEHFWRNGHSVRLMVFDDSSPTNQQKYYPVLEQTRTHSPIHYIGPREKEQFLAYLNARLRDRRFESLVRNLFRPSYGGNRNFTLMYTLGELMISSDDDMRLYLLVEYSPESLAADEVSRGRLHRANQKRLYAEVVRHRTGVPGRAGEARPRSPRQLRARRVPGGLLHGSRNQRHHGPGARKLANPAPRPCARRRDCQNGADLPLRHQRHRRHRLR